MAGQVHHSMRLPPGQGVGGPPHPGVGGPPLPPSNRPHPGHQAPHGGQQQLLHQYPGQHQGGVIVSVAQQGPGHMAGPPNHQTGPLMSHMGGPHQQPPRQHHHVPQQHQGGPGYHQHTRQQHQPDHYRPPQHPHSVPPPSHTFHQQQGGAPAPLPSLPVPHPPPTSYQQGPVRLPAPSLGQLLDPNCGPPLSPGGLASSKEKTPMCLVNELARFNKVQHQYRLTDESGPAHKKTFTVCLKIGDKEEYIASGPSIKKAQHAASAIALEKTQFKHPSPKAKNLKNANITPTVELNALAMKRGEPTTYTFLEPNAARAAAANNTNGYNGGSANNFASNSGGGNRGGGYGQRTGSAGYPPLFCVQLRVGARDFMGEGATVQAAKHGAAGKALKMLRDLPLPEGKYKLDPTSLPFVPGSEYDELKSPISLVHEIAPKRNLLVQFDVTRETGPPHMRDFITKCIVGDFVTEGEGNGKKNNNVERGSQVRDVAEKRLLPSHLIGFQNMGNSCYVAATMQILLGLPPFLTEAVNILGALQRIKSKETGAEPVPLLSYFVGLYQTMQAGRGGWANRNLWLLKEEMGRLDQQFQGNKMEDANEFLGRFIDELKESLDRNFKNEGHRLANIVDTNFKYNTEETYVCLDCGISDTSRHTDVNFFLDMFQTEAHETSHVASLQNLLAASLGEEMRERRCKECGGRWASACKRLASLPRVLLICLKRYDYVDGQAGRKVTRPVDIPEIISLTELVSEEVRLPSPAPKLASRTTSLSTGSTVATALHTGRDATSHPVLCPPSKFKGKTDLEMSQMSEEEQLEYLLFRSKQETELTTSNMTEEAQLQAALKASLMDISSFEDRSPLEPEVKRSRRELIKATSRKEAKDLKRVLEDGILGDNSHLAGHPSHHYRLSGVVSHFGAGTNSGHYIADVVRYDAGSQWFRYDDQVVTRTDQASVRCGRNRVNGYIFLYLHQPVSKQCSLEFAKK